LLEGANVAHFNDDELSALRREKFGFIFQSFNLIARNTVLENIEVPLFYQGWHERRSRERARELAEMVGLGDRVRHRPAELSGGQRQRAAIARALANDPSVILADEPTGNLDSRTGAEIMAVLDSLVAEGRTIILVTHENEIAAHAHRIIRLSDGMIESDRRIDRGKS
jgi:putative ABC transport system ATP-binding protein